MRLLIAFALLAAPATVLADPGKTADAHAMHTDDCARARAQHKTCVLDMGQGDDIEGNAPTAGGAAIGIIKFAKSSSLVRIRRDFIVEILKSAEDI
jgi:hypothetical protein